MLRCAVNVTSCGDRVVGNQSVWWRAVEPEKQCFGLSRPDQKCSKSMTDSYHCLVGEGWDQLRAELNYPQVPRRAPAVLEVRDHHPDLSLPYG